MSGNATAWAGFCPNPGTKLCGDIVREAVLLPLTGPLAFDPLQSHNLCPIPPSASPRGTLWELPQMGRKTRRAGGAGGSQTRLHTALTGRNRWVTLQREGCHPRWPLGPERKPARIPPFYILCVCVCASFRSSEVHTLAVGRVKPHFLLAGIKCCCVTVHLDLASYIALLIGRAIPVTA